MGMDSYLYKTTPEEAAKYQEYKVLYDKYDAELITLWEGFRTKYPGFDQIFDLTKEDRDREVNEGINLIRERFVAMLTPEDVKEYDRLNQLLNDVDYDNVDDEIIYWRKPYPLHAYIVKHFFKGEDECNLERVYLTKEDVAKIIEDLRSGELMKQYDGECEYFDQDDVNKTVEKFENLTWDDDTLYFYYTWY